MLLRFCILGTLQTYARLTQSPWAHTDPVQRFSDTPWWSASADISGSLSKCSVWTGSLKRWKIRCYRLRRFSSIHIILRQALSYVQTDPTVLANNSQHRWMLHVASVCTPCRIFVRVVVGSCCGKFEIGQTFSPVQTDAILLAKNSQQCWELLRPVVQTLGSAIHRVNHYPADKY